MRDEILVWTLPVPTAFANKFSDCLTREERDRADRYKFPKVRAQFLTCRVALRHILGGCLNVAPAEVPISYTSEGKPVLAAPGRDLHFNVTHTDELAMIALATRPVGIDIERVRPMADPGRLVERFFSPAEREAYRALPLDLREAGFFRGWTCKEAVIKAAGLGVMVLDRFDVELHPDRPPAVSAARHPHLAGCEWFLSTWQPDASFVAAVAHSCG